MSIAEWYNDEIKNGGSKAEGEEALLQALLGSPRKRSARDIRIINTCLEYLNRYIDANEHPDEDLHFTPGDLFYTLHTLFTNDAAELLDTDEEDCDDIGATWAKRLLLEQVIFGVLMDKFPENCIDESYCIGSALNIEREGADE